MEKQLEKIIYNWVAKNFGESEADDPSRDIKALAGKLARHQHELYWSQELEYLRDDVETYAEQHGYKLTEQELYAVADKIRSSDWYCSINAEDMEYYINQELNKGEQL